MPECIQYDTVEMIQWSNRNNSYYYYICINNLAMDELRKLRAWFHMAGFIKDIHNNIAIVIIVVIASIKFIITIFMNMLAVLLQIISIAIYSLHDMLCCYQMYIYSSFILCCYNTLKSNHDHCLHAVML